MKKQILKRGYITYCLTDSKKAIYNKKGEKINWNMEENRQEQFYWSEVYCEADHLTVIIRKGTALVNPTAAKLKKLNEQSILNCTK